MVAAFAGGYAVGTPINHTVIEPWLWGDPVTEPGPQPQPDPGDDDDDNDDGCKPDDFGRKCPSLSMEVVTVYVTRPKRDYPHAALGVGKRVIEGWVRNPLVPIEDDPRTGKSIFHGWRQPSEHMRNELKISYEACPLTIEALEEAMDSYTGTLFDLYNRGARNCAGWVCEMLRAGEPAPLEYTQPPTEKLYTPSPVPCGEPGLTPYHLLPKGKNVPLIYNRHEYKDILPLLESLFLSQ